MSLIIKNLDVVDIELDDLGLTLPASSTVDLITEEPADVAASANGGNLFTEVTALRIAVLDPLDDITQLSAADGLEALAAHNDTHWRVAGATLNQLDDVNITLVGSPPLPSVDDILQFNGAEWVNVPASSGVITISTIGGQPIPTFSDTTRSKQLSVESPSYLFAEAYLSDSDWIQIGDASDSDSGYIMPFNGTVVGMSAHCENDNGSSKGIWLYINTTNQGTIGSFGGVGSNSSFNVTNVNINFSAGDRIRLRANTTGGSIRDTVVSVRVRWRA